MASTAAPVTERLSMSEIIRLPEFQRLTPQQQIFVSCFISSGVQTGTYNALGSVMKAYNVSMKNAPGLAAQMLAHKKIARILDLHFGRTERSELDALLAVLCKAIKKSIRHDLRYRGTISVATTKALEFFERQTGKSLRRSRGANPPVADVAEPKVVEPASAAAVVPARFAVGDIAILQGKKYRVTAVNPDGSVSEADPLS